jgi:large subunit ribosomal protein L18
MMNVKNKRPRLVVKRSNKNIYAQLLDNNGKVLVSASTLSKEFKSLNMKSTNKQAAYEVGKIIAKKILDLNIKEIWFDRNKYKYHGRVKALADGAREGGLSF